MARIGSQLQIPFCTLESTPCIKESKAAQLVAELVFVAAWYPVPVALQGNQHKNLASFGVTPFNT